MAETQIVESALPLDQTHVGMDAAPVEAPAPVVNNAPEAGATGGQDPVVDAVIAALGNNPGEIQVTVSESPRQAEQRKNANLALGATALGVAIMGVTDFLPDSAKPYGYGIGGAVSSFGLSRLRKGRS